MDLYWCSDMQNLDCFDPVFVESYDLELNICNLNTYVDGRDANSSFSSLNLVLIDQCGVRNSPANCNRLKKGDCLSTCLTIVTAHKLRFQCYWLECYNKLDLMLGSALEIQVAVNKQMLTNFDCQKQSCWTLGDFTLKWS